MPVARRVFICYDEAMQADVQPFVTPEEYLALERQAEAKNEYCAGEISAMAGASQRHNLIAANVVASLHAQLRGRPCSVFPGDMRVKVSATGLYTYPDVTVVCDQARFDDQHQDTLLDPVLIVEILSKTTSGYDRGEKFEQYRKIGSFVEYLLISQERCYIEHFVRQSGNQWLLSESDQLQDVIELSSVACSLALADVYEKVDISELRLLK